MTNFLYNLFIYPIVIVYEIIYNLFNSAFHSNVDINNAELYSILMVSLFVNIITFPLYKKADEIQKEVRLKKKGMQKWIDHINKNYKGDERYFILSTYYKENDYKPIDELKESLSLLLQIPFFAAAYIYFTSNPSLDKAYIFDTIRLGRPDSLLEIGSISINILPIIMTIINIVSACIYTKGFKLKEKMSSFILPIIFLIILYNSPSALVIYWTLNNIFSLIKIIYLKSKNVKENNEKVQLTEENSKKSSIDKSIIWILMSMSIFAGVIIPSLVIKASPDEFDSAYYSAFSFIINNFIVFLGFSFWLFIFYIFSENKNTFKNIIFAINIYIVVNHLLYINNIINISTLLKLSSRVEFGMFTIITNIIIFIALVLVVNVFFKLNKTKHTYVVNLLSKVFIITFMIWSFVNLYDIYKGINGAGKNNAVAFESDEQKRKASGDVFYGKKVYVRNKISEGKSNTMADGSAPIVNISTKGKNVVMFCLDRYVARYFDYVIKVLPELKEKFEGFTIYDNTISFGANTITAAPSMYGGYEYIPTEINKRNKELYKTHNEAISIMPKILSDAGYSITVSEIPYENYYEVDKESVWDKIDNVKSVYLEDSIKSKVIEENIHGTYETMKRNFIFYSIVRISPVILKSSIYDRGRYLHRDDKIKYDTMFLESYAILDKLPDLAKVVDNDTDNAFILHNLLSHQPNDLNYPDFYPEANVENKKNKNDYMKNLVNKDGVKFTGNEEILDVAIACMINIGKFLDYLRENGAYNNTRIVIVSDHGGFDDRYDFDKLGQVKKMNKDSSLGLAICNPQAYNPILMYKDFDSVIYKESDEFMTNADVPYLMLNGIIDDLKNPYTGNDINMNYKNENNQYNIISHVKHQVGYHIGKKKFTTIAGHWEVFNNDNQKNGIYNEKNWEIIFEEERE